MTVTIPTTVARQLALFVDTEGQGPGLLTPLLSTLGARISSVVLASAGRDDSIARWRAAIAAQDATATITEITALRQNRAGEVALVLALGAHLAESQTPAPLIIGISSDRGFAEALAHAIQLGRDGLIASGVDGRGGVEARAIGLAVLSLPEAATSLSPGAVTGRIVAKCAKTLPPRLVAPRVLR
jgi:hypothetical protein